MNQQAEQVDRLLPQNIEAEAGVLGSCLIDPEAMAVAVEELDPDDFYRDAHRVIFQTGRDLFYQREPCDLINWTGELDRRGKLEEVGGASYVSSLTNNVPSSANIRSYARRVKNKADLRRLIHAGVGIAKAAYDEPQDIDALFKWAVERIHGSRGKPGSRQDEPTTGDTVAPFPLKVLPDALRALVEQGAQSIHCPVDFLAVPLLVLGGVAIGTSHCLEIKHGWREYARLWAAVIALTGDKKSPALDRVMQPFYQRQRAHAREYESAMTEWEQKREGSEPALKQLFTTDATLEALAHLLADNPRGVLFSRDELGGWVAGFNQYRNGKGADRQNWLSLWNGAPIVVNRRGHKRPIMLSEPFVGVVGAMPPDMLGDLADERGREDGFVHRLLFSFPDHMPRKWTKIEMDEAVIEGFQKAINALLNLTSCSATEPRVLHLTRGGTSVWEDWIRRHYAEGEDPSFPDYLRGPWAKLEGYAGRFALVVHLFRVVCGETEDNGVDEVDMAGAVDLVDYFKSHARRVYAHMHAAPEDLQAVAAIQWIDRRSQEQITSRDLQRAGIKGVSSSDEAKGVLRDLAHRGYGIWWEERARGGTKIVFRRLHSTVDRSTPSPDRSAS